MNETNPTQDPWAPVTQAMQRGDRLEAVACPEVSANTVRFFELGIALHAELDGHAAGEFAVKLATAWIVAATPMFQVVPEWRSAEFYKSIEVKRKTDPNP